MFSQQHAPLIIDVAGYQLTEQDRQRLLNPLVGGAIHFARNWQDRQQLTALNAAIKQLRPDLLIAVDQEGGRVQRFKTDGFTPLPPMAKLGEIAVQQPQLAQQLALAVGYVLAAELRACGVDFSFTPVLDLDFGTSAVIGDRAFAAQPQLVTSLVQSLIYGLALAGMGNCGKHFPGHGYVAADSHLEVPLDQRALSEIVAADLIPYAQLSPLLTSVMPAHVVYTQVDTKPAGFSEIWLQQILRQQLGFSGAIFSDDLSMAGARVLNGVELSFADAAALALSAGCDLVLLCNQSPKEALLDQFLAQLQQDLASGKWQQSSASERRRQQLLPSSPALNWQQLQQQAKYQIFRQLLADIN